MHWKIIRIRRSLFRTSFVFLFFLLLGLSFFLGTKYEWNKENASVSIKDFPPQPMPTPTQTSILFKYRTIKKYKETNTWKSVQFHAVSFKIPSDWNITIKKSVMSDATYAMILDLEAQRDKNPDPAPYVIWYFPKTTLVEAKANQILDGYYDVKTTTVEEVIFNNLQAELFTARISPQYPHLFHTVFLADRSDTYMLREDPKGRYIKDYAVFEKILSTVTLTD